MFLPLEPYLYLACEGEIASPYITRFDVSYKELEAYFDSHERKIPTKVVVINYGEETFSNDEEEIVECFLENGYIGEHIDANTFVISMENSNN